MEFVCTSSHYNGEVIINIKDRGTGIDIDMDDKIFSKFATKSDTGSGLGFALHIKSIVETYGGRIWAESSSSDCKGGSFTFNQPCYFLNSYLS